MIIKGDVKLVWKEPSLVVAENSVLLSEPNIFVKATITYWMEDLVPSRSSFGLS